MSSAKLKWLEDAARVIDGRVKALEEELERDAMRHMSTGQPSESAMWRDRAAISEAKHCARLIRALKQSAPYRAYRDPHEIASNIWSGGGA